jgi:HEAT repeat protein
MPVPDAATIIQRIDQDPRAARGELEQARTPEEIERIGQAIAVADPRVRRILAQVLSRVGSPAALPTLSGLLEDPDPEVIAAAEDAIGNSGFEQTIPDDLRARIETRLLELLESGDSPRPVRTGAQYALGLLGTRSAVPALIRALDDEEPIVRWNSAEALTHIGDPAALSALRARAEHEDHPRVAQFLKIALKELSG